MREHISILYEVCERMCSRTCVCVCGMCVVPTSRPVGLNVDPKCKQKGPDVLVLQKSSLNLSKCESYDTLVGLELGPDSLRTLQHPGTDDERLVVPTKARTTLTPLSAQSRSGSTLPRHAVGHSGDPQTPTGSSEGRRMTYKMFV